MNTSAATRQKIFASQDWKNLPGVGGWAFITEILNALGTFCDEVLPGPRFILWSHNHTSSSSAPFVPGIQTSQDARFYALSARFEPFSNEGKPLVIQFTIKHEQKIDCGGGYVKIFPSALDQSAMHGDSQYYIMFGKSCLSLQGH